MAVRVKPEDVAHLLPPGVAGAAEGRKRSKYRNVPAIYNGVRYDSGAEARRAEELDVLIAAGVVRCRLDQVKFRLGVPENVYRVDFVVIPTEGPPWCEDVKGAPTAKFRRDAKLWARYGPMPLHVIYRDRTEVIEGKST